MLICFGYLFIKEFPIFMNALCILFIIVNIAIIAKILLILFTCLIFGTKNQTNLLYEAFYSYERILRFIFSRIQLSLQKLPKMLNILKKKLIKIGVNPQYSSILAGLIGLAII